MAISGQVCYANYVVVLYVFFDGFADHGAPEE